MERLNIKLVSLLIVIGIFLTAGSAQAAVEPIQEQKECSDSRCPNVNIGSEYSITGGALVGTPIHGWSKSVASGQAVDWHMIILPPGGTLEIQGKPGEILIPPNWALRAGLG